MIKLIAPELDETILDIAYDLVSYASWNGSPQSVAIDLSKMIEEYGQKMYSRGVSDVMSEEIVSEEEI